MRDIPMFTTEFGVASLVLKEIPYQSSAYITLHHSLEPEKLLQESVQFCRMCGAERIYATGSDTLEKYPLYTALWELRRSREGMPETDAALWPVQEQTLDQWRELYNKKVVSVPNGAWMTQSDGKQMLDKGDGYFIHRDGQLLGIGRASGDRIDWVAAVRPGAGREVVCALSHALAGDVITLTVASENRKALELYENLGFIKSKELSRWYII